MKRSQKFLLSSRNEYYSCQQERATKTSVFYSCCLEHTPVNPTDVNTSTYGFSWQSSVCKFAFSSSLPIWQFIFSLPRPFIGFLRRHHRKILIGLKLLLLFMGSLIFWSILTIGFCLQICAVIVDFVIQVCLPLSCGIFHVVLKNAVNSSWILSQIPCG